MHIKQVIVQGFKTYKDRTVIDEFDEKHNVILGKNGSGKSNVFAAIQFVLSDKYSTLRTEDRQRLLHEGSGREIMMASVEVIFDNQDMRFPVDREVISIKRTIGLKKDEYFLNNQHMSKTDVVNLLESAGLSRSNPYYIVEQGKVRHLISMNEQKRLELFKEIAGTRTYDDRRHESLKIMSDTDNRTAQIEEVIGFIENRLSELEDEKKELKEYQNLDSQRRCLEYTLYNKELKEAKSELTKNDEIRLKSSEQSQDSYVRASEVEAERQEVEEKLRTTSEQLAKDSSEMKRVDKTFRKLLKQRAQVELKVSDGRESAESKAETKRSAEQELEELEEKMSRLGVRRAQLAKDFDAKTKVEEVLKQRLEFSKQRITDLYAKQGRKQRFSTKKQRDDFLKKEIRQIKADITKQAKQQRTLEQETKSVQSELESARRDVAKQEKAISKLKKEVDKVSEEFNNLTDQRDEEQNKRKEFWRQESKHTKELDSLKAALERASHMVERTMDRELWKGLQAIKAITEEKRMKGVHGPLVELFTCEEKFQKCVETTAGNRLFNVVVDNDRIASNLIRELNRRKAGRVTFIPLNRISAKKQTYPTSMDVIPMVTKLAYNSRFEKAIQQVFGKTLVTRSIEVAATYAREHNFDTITLSGDQVNKKGALTGGFIDHKRSRLNAQKELQVAQETFETRQAELTDAKEAGRRIDQEVTRILGEVHKSKERRTHVRNLIEQAIGDRDAGQSKVALHKKTLDRNDKLVATLKSAIKNAEDKISNLTEELNSELLSKLNAADQKELIRLQEEVSEMNNSLIQAGSERSEAESEKAVVDNMFTDNLQKRKDELVALLQSSASEEAQEAFQELEKKLEIIQETVKESKQRKKELSQATRDAKEMVKQLQGRLESLQTKEKERNRALARSSKSMEVLLNKRATLVQKVDECEKQIRDLGSLPTDAFSKYVSWNEKKLMRSLESCNTKLKKYSHVNKKAIDQYVNFTEQRESLLQRKTELDEGRQSIMDLISHLDNKKSEAIDRTYKGIASHFSKVFKELVPDGKGTLVMHTAAVGEDAKDAEEEEGQPSKKKRKKAKRGKKAVGPSTGVREYSGVGIKVSFTGSDQHQSMMQLSGGQQTVVALSLIFAIQRCDPSPFYLFDEIDSNLDAVHRTSVARMIHSQSIKEGGTQFITTTFRPEMLVNAHKFYGVSFANKVSKVAVITREEAQQIIIVQERENRHTKQKESRKRGRDRQSRSRSASAQ